MDLWVGEPIAIEDDVKATIRKQAGSNLLVAGYDEEVGAKIMCSSIVSIAAQQAPDSCTFYNFNFFNVDSDVAEIPEQLFDSVNQQKVTINKRNAKENLDGITQEIETRNAADNPNDFQNIYLCFHALQRGRMFRKEGMSMSEEGELLEYILKEGPDVGIYSLIQVDNMDNFAKNLDDRLLNEFSQRVISQTNAESSYKLIGSQKAAHLGSNRAFYFDDNENVLKKLKPYETPHFSWVAGFHQEESSTLPYSSQV